MGRNCTWVNSAKGEGAAHPWASARSVVRDTGRPACGWAMKRRPVEADPGLGCCGGPRGAGPSLALELGRIYRRRRGGSPGARLREAQSTGRAAGSSLIQRKRGAALVFSFEAEEASGKNCSSRLGARRTQADAAGLRRGQQGKDGGDRTRERARAAAGFGSGSRCLVGEQRTTVASGAAVRLRRGGSGKLRGTAPDQKERRASALFSDEAAARRWFWRG